MLFIPYIVIRVSPFVFLHRYAYHQRSPCVLFMASHSLIHGCAYFLCIRLYLFNRCNSITTINRNNGMSFFFEITGSLFLVLFFWLFYWLVLVVPICSVGMVYHLGTIKLNTATIRTRPLSRFAY